MTKVIARDRLSSCLYQDWWCMILESGAAIFWLYGVPRLHVINPLRGTNMPNEAATWHDDLLSLRGVAWEVSWSWSPVLHGVQLGVEVGKGKQCQFQTWQLPTLCMDPTNGTMDWWMHTIMENSLHSKLTIDQDLKPWISYGDRHCGGFPPWHYQAAPPALWAASCHAGCGKFVGKRLRVDDSIMIHDDCWWWTMFCDVLSHCVRRCELINDRGVDMVPPCGVSHLQGLAQEESCISPSNGTLITSWCVREAGDSHSGVKQLWNNIYAIFMQIRSHSWYMLDCIDRMFPLCFSKQVDEQPKIWQTLEVPRWCDPWVSKRDGGPRGGGWVRNLFHAFSVEGRLRLKIKAKHWRLNLWKLEELLWIACGKLFRIFQSTLADCNLPQLWSVDLISCELHLRWRERTMSKLSTNFHVEISIQCCQIAVIC